MCRDGETAANQCGYQHKSRIPMPRRCGGECGGGWWPDERMKSIPRRGDRRYERHSKLNGGKYESNADHPPRAEAAQTSRKGTNPAKTGRQSNYSYCCIEVESGRVRNSCSLSEYLQ